MSSKPLTRDQIAQRAITAENKRRAKQAPLLSAAGALEPVGADYGDQYVAERDRHAEEFRRRMAEHDEANRRKGEWYKARLRQAVTPEEFQEMEAYARNTFWIARDLGYQVGYWGTQVKKYRALTQAEYYTVTFYGPEGLNDPAAVEYGRELVRVFSADYTPSMIQQTLLVGDDARQDPQR